jgi:NarL family two-component system response regulator LiaR
MTVNDNEIIRVMIVDDHLVVRDGLKMFLSVHDDLLVIAEAHDGDQAVEICSQALPDVILMDILMPGMDGPTATQRIRENHPDIQVIALTSFADQELVQSALKSGAISYLLKDVHADRLAQAIRDAYQGRGTVDAVAAQSLMSAVDSTATADDPLTPRETEILKLMTAGATNKEIAQQLTISVGTVRFHVSNILSKLGVENRTEAVSQALQRGIFKSEL